MRVRSFLLIVLLLPPSLLIHPMLFRPYKRSIALLKLQKEGDEFVLSRVDGTKLPVEKVLVDDTLFAKTQAQIELLQKLGLISIRRLIDGKYTVRAHGIITTR